MGHTAYPAMDAIMKTVNANHIHKFFIQESLLSDLPLDLLVCGICGYSTTRVYVD
jgi:hypothetical protein